ncbi:MAG: hypothetical protein VYD19_04780 [Myxococcota bacterium]|nr:hypothetical protein [Myxococcota bacterium]
MRKPRPHRRRWARRISAWRRVQCIGVCSFALTSCAEESASLSLRSALIDLESPEGVIDSAGPWILRAALRPGAPPPTLRYQVSEARTVSSELMDMARADLDTAGDGGVTDRDGGSTSEPPFFGGWRPLPITESARARQWIALLPNLPMGLTLRFELGVGSERFPRWLRRRLRGRTPQLGVSPYACLIRFLDPVTDTRLTAQDDRGAAAGHQQIFRLTSRAPDGALIRLSSGDAVTLIERSGEQNIGRLTLAPGRQQVLAELFYRDAQCSDMIELTLATTEEGRGDE